MKKSIKLFVAVITFCLGLVSFQNTVAAPDSVTVAYFLEWPTPNQVDQLKKTFDKKFGVPVKWRSFGNGNEMSAAMASGDVDIAYSQGLVPFVLAVNENLPITMVNVAVTYAENDNCVVHKSAGITKANAKDLHGKKVATPLGNVTHYKLLKSLEYLDVDVSKVRILKMNPNEGAAALARGDVAMACGFGGGLNRMKDYGKVLLTAAEQESFGLKVFDITSVTNSFAKNHPNLVVDFLQITEDANKNFANNPTKYYQTIAKAASMSVADTKSTMAKFGFPLKQAQLSSTWLGGGGVSSFIKEVADFYVDQGTLDSALDDYSKFIDASYMQQVK